MARSQAWRLAAEFGQAEFALERGLGRGEPCRLSETKETPQTILQRKGREPIAALTAYDFAMARLLKDAEVPLLLVGDSLGMVVLGYPDTTHVSLEEMEHHVRAVARAKPRGLIVADLPFETYETTAQAVESARRLVAAGAEAVKAEGGGTILPQLEAPSSPPTTSPRSRRWRTPRSPPPRPWRGCRRSCAPTPRRLARRAHLVSCSSLLRRPSQLRSRA